MSNKGILICGLPCSGKTTFIAALWHTVFYKQTTTTLVLNSFPKNRSYINRLAKNWATFKPLDRTTLTENNQISLNVRDVGSGRNFDLNLPDLSGENWQNLWINRSCSDEIANLVKNSDCVMLFIHADKIIQPICIEIDQYDDDEVVVTDFKEWDPTKSPTQVVLVDMLQSILQIREGETRARLAIVISAWDKARATGLTPETYLGSYFPLLKQYIDSSRKIGECKIFGVSAIGGDLEVAAELTRIKEHSVATERVQVVSGDIECKDLTLPIHWLISKNDE